MSPCSFAIEGESILTVITGDQGASHSRLLMEVTESDTKTQR